MSSSSAAAGTANEARDTNDALEFAENNYFVLTILTNLQLCTKIFFLAWEKPVTKAGPTDLRLAL